MFEPHLYSTTPYHAAIHAGSGSRYMNPPAPIQYTQTQPYHGTKRSAPDDEVETSANISTEFKKLRLNNVPSSTVSQTHQTSHAIRTQHETVLAPPPVRLDGVGASHSNHPEDSMTVDETPNRIFIYDLDREIAEIEAAEFQHGTSSTSFFLPEIDKNISKIPLNVLRQNFDNACSRPSSCRAANEQALVLYRDPSSITVPEEEDAVRKTIIAARKEAREKIKQDYERQVLAEKAAATNGIFNKDSGHDMDMDDDVTVDAMDIE